MISRHCVCHELVEFETRKIYPDAVTQIALVLLEKDANAARCRHIWIRGNSGWQRKLAELLENKETVDSSVESSMLPSEALNGGDWSFGIVDVAEVRQPTENIGTPIGALPIQICSGIVTGNDDVFLVREIRKSSLGATIVRTRYEGDYLIEPDLLRPIVRNREISAFNSPSPKLLCVTPYDASGQLISENHFADLYPKGHRYLQLHRQRLVANPSDSCVPWYSFRSAAALKLPPGPKVMMKRISIRPDYTLDPAETLLCNGTVILLAPTSMLIDPLILLAVVNSYQFWSFVRANMPTMGDGFALRVSRLCEFCFPTGHDIDGERRHIQDLVAERLTLSAKSDKSAKMTNLINQAVARLYALVDRT